MTEHISHIALVSFLRRNNLFVITDPDLMAELGMATCSMAVGAGI